MYFLRLLSGVVLGVGLLISALSAYLLLLSIYLLLQKNSRQLENLLLLGYSQRQLVLPYVLLTLVTSSPPSALSSGCVVTTSRRPAASCPRSSAPRCCRRCS